MNGIQENRSSHEHGLFIARRLLGKRDSKGIGIGKDFSFQALWFLYNLSQMVSITIGISLGSRKDPKGNLAAALAETRIAFTAALNAHSSAARGRMDLVEGFAIGLGNSVSGDAVVAVFLDLTKSGASRREIRLLEAAALAAAGNALCRTIHCNKFRVGVEFLHTHLEGMNGSAKDPTAAISIFQRLRNLRVSDKVTKLGLCLAAQEFLAKPASCLAHHELGRAAQVSLHGVRARAIHLLSLHL